MGPAHPFSAPPHATRPLSGSVRLPGSEAAGHHALLLAALAVGESRIAGLPEHENVLRMASAVRGLGAEAVQDAPGTWRVTGRGVGGLREPRNTLDMGGSGVAARLVCGVLASHDLFATVTGSAGLRRQPMRWVTDMLRDCGARFERPADAWLPLAVKGARDAVPIERRLSARTAAAKPALLLAGLNAPGWTRVTEDAPTCDLLARLLRHFGASVAVERCGNAWTTSLTGQPELRAADVALPGDPFLAALVLAAALVVPGSAVTVRGVATGPRQAGLLAALRDMGAHLEVGGERWDGGGSVADVTARHTGLHGADVLAGSMADHLALAVAAACATGPTRLRWVRAASQEEDASPLPATLAMLRSNGTRADEEDDGIVVHGAAPLGGVRVGAGAPPCAALCGLVLSLAAGTPARMDEAAAIENGFPGALALLRRIGAPLP